MARHRVQAALIAVYTALGRELQNDAMRAQTMPRATSSVSI
jgi:hypothetical protein